MTVFDLPERPERPERLEHDRGVQGGDEHSEVRIEVAAAPSRLAPVRVVAADLAARADFDLDAVADLRIAVDEACSTLVSLAAPGAWLRCSVKVVGDDVVVVASVPVAAATVVPRNSFGWRVLATLTDDVQVVGGRSPGATLSIELQKRRAGPHP